MKKILQLFNTARSNDKSKIYKKGLNVKSYASQAMGKRQDDTMPLFDYEPANVLEPIEYMFYMPWPRAEQLMSASFA